MKTNILVSNLYLFGRKQDTELRNSKWEHELRYVDGFQQLQGKNGGGDLWSTDGRPAIVVLKQNPDMPASP